MGPARNPPTHWTTLRVHPVLSMPTLAVQPPHVCHHQRDWAVSIGSHMQQDMGISQAPPHPGAPFPFDIVQVRKTMIPKIGDNSSRDIDVS